MGEREEREGGKEGERERECERVRESGGRGRRSERRKGVYNCVFVYQNDLFLWSVY